MSIETTKDFSPILDDYAFFEEHSTEAQADLRAYVTHLQDFSMPSGVVNVLDFGCGAGRFSEMFLRELSIPKDRLRLSLVEPSDVSREHALTRLKDLSTHPIEARVSLSADHQNAFDLIIANHVFYYVPNLDGTIATVLKSRAQPGIFLTSLAGQDNSLIQIWNESFALMGRPVPFHTAEDVKATLVKQGCPFETKAVPYGLSFVDSEENRLRILRFLLGQSFQEAPRQAILELFDRYESGGRIVMETASEQFICRTS